MDFDSTELITIAELSVANMSKSHRSQDNDALDHSVSPLHPHPLKRVRVYQQPSKNGLICHNLSKK